VGGGGEKADADSGTYKVKKKKRKKIKKVLAITPCYKARLGTQDEETGQA
jgi:hypothetical protein